MGDLPHFKISLKDILKEISRQSNNGIEKILIVSPNVILANNLLAKLKEGNIQYECEIKVYTEFQYYSRSQEPVKGIYEIDLHQIELT